MTKNQLLDEYNKLCEQKGMFTKIDSINGNSGKDEIANAIDCLKCTDEKLDEYLTVIKQHFPSTYKKICTVGNYKTHRFNRLYVYNTAKLMLAE